MKTKLLCFSLLMLGMGGSLFAQNSANGNISATSANCFSVASSCVWESVLPPNAGTTTIAISGTFSATLLVEESNNGGTTWSTAATLSTTGTTTYSTNGFTDIRVRCSAYTSGTAVVTISTGLLQVQSVVAGGSSSSSPSSAPNMGFYLTPQCQAGQLNCVSTFADTVENNTCSWTNASTTVTCLTEAIAFGASITSNVATYTGTFPANWVAGNSVTIVSFLVADTFFNQTCTLSTATTTAVTCPLVHADATASSAGTVINNNVGPFTSADVGKVVKGGQTCASDQGTIGGQISTTVDVTILALISTTQITLSATPSATATLSTAYPQGSCLIYGHLDDAAATSLETLLQLSPTCPKLFQAAANYFFSKPHFFNNPLACDNIGPGIGMPYNFGNTVLSAGFEIEGRGTGTTAWYLSASFPNGDPCNHKPNAQQASQSSTLGACFSIPTLGKWTDFRIDGGPQSGAGSLPAGGTTLIFADFGTLMNFTCINMGYTVVNQVGIELGGVVALYQVNNAGCGGVAIKQNSTAGGTSQLFRVTAENAAATSLLMQAPILCNGCLFLGGIAKNNSSAVIENQGSILRMQNSIVSPSPGGLNAKDIILGYKCTVPNCVLYASDVNFSFFSSGGASNLSGSIQCLTVNPCTNYLHNTTLTSQSAGATINDGTTGNSVTVLEGGNSIQPTRLLTTGTIIADGRSLLGICTGVATASSTLALNITGLATTGTGIPTTCNGTTLDKGVTMIQNSTLSTLQCSSSATTVSVACTVMVNGVASALTCTMTAATSCQDEFGGHTVAVLKGDLVSMRIVTGAAETGANIKAFVMWQ